MDRGAWHQTTLPVSWEIWLQVKKQQLELDMEQQTGSKLGKEYVKAVYCHSAYLTYKQITSWEMLHWMKHKLESRLLGDISISSGRSLSHVWLFVTPWTTAHQPSLSITNCRSLPKPMSIELMMPSNHLIFCQPLLLLPSIFSNIRVVSNESGFRIRWPKYRSLSFNISPSNEHPGLISFRMDWMDLLAVQGISRVFSNTIFQKHQFFSAQPSLYSNSHIHTWLLEKP